MSVSEAAGGVGEMADGRAMAPKRPQGSARSRGMVAKLTDRTFVLMLGVGLGVAIGYAFGSQGQPRRPASAAAAQPAEQAAAPVPAPALPRTVAAAPVQGPAAAKPERSVALEPVRTTAPLFCPPEPTPQMLHTLASGGPVRIGVFGDSFGDGVWAALYHRFPHAKGYEVLRFSQPSTGFTRYRQVNLEEKAKAQLAAGPVDVAVINFGANDDQGLFDGGHVAALLSADWRRVYADRAERFVGVLRAQGATVYWMGLPKMRKDAYDHDLDVLSATVSERMAKLGVPYIPVRALSVDANGDYSDYLAGADGESRLMRATDGVHMTALGYSRLAEPVARQVESYIDHARAVAGGVPGPMAAHCVALSDAAIPASQPSAPPVASSLP
jgi:hypothetical protein